MTTRIPSPSTDDGAVELWGRVVTGFEVTHRRIHQAIDDRFSLSPAEAQVLLSLHGQPGHRAPMVTLAQAASFTTGGFTKLADKLARRGLVRRVACEEDRRVTFLEFTPDGSAVADDLTHLAARTHREVFIDVLGEDRARFVAEAMTELSRAHSGPAA